MKYKLIKEYPGSPKLGTILTHKELQYCNWNEYYQEVVEKDYEILSMECNKSSLLHFNNVESSINFMLKNDYSIHSVKRLSDSEIFAIGDIVKCEDCKGKITSLEIYDNDIYLTGIDNETPFGFTLCKALDCFEIPQKVKKPLFTTEDGVGIFEGDISFGVNSNFKLLLRELLLLIP